MSNLSLRALALVPLLLISAPALAQTDVNRLPGDHAGASQAWGRNASVTLPSGADALASFITVQPGQHITIETAALRVTLPVGQTPIVSLGAHFESDTGSIVVPVYLALQRIAVYTTPQGDRVLWGSTNTGLRVHVDSFSGIDVMRQGGTAGPASFSIGLTGYVTEEAVTLPPPG